MKFSRLLKIPGVTRQTSKVSALLLLAPFAILALPVTALPEMLGETLRIPRIAGEWITIAPSPGAGPEEDSSTRDNPFIIELAPGQHYLFRPQDTGPGGVTSVYFSEDPLHFGRGSNADALHLLTRLPVASPELVQIHGNWFISSLSTGEGPLNIAPLVWEPLPAKLPRDDRTKIRVALYDDSGSSGRGVPRTQELLGVHPDLEVITFPAPFLWSGGLRDCDVVVFTGGSGSRQANTIGLAGREAVRRFIEQGGGYLGICAGHYLACEGFSWSAAVLNARTKSPLWRRGVGDVKMEPTPAAREIFGWTGDLLDIRYANGPIIEPSGASGIEDYEVLAYFRTELSANNTPPGLMTGSPAIVSARLGKGRVLCSSAHPEQTPGLDHFLERSIRWLTQPE